MKKRSSQLKVGDWVEVRSKKRSSDTRQQGPVGQHCVMRRCPVVWAEVSGSKRAHKTCDTVFRSGALGRRAIHLETRVAGSAWRLQAVLNLLERSVVETCQW